MGVTGAELRALGRRPGRPERPLGGGRAIVVVPVYRPRPDPDEAFSWRRCLDVFGDHALAIVAPDGLDVAAYVDVAQGGRPVEVIRFDPAFFLSTGHYSRLLLSTGFYDPLTSYDFVLVHQLDAFAFRDDLDEWCDRDFDFVGAPWIDLEWVAEARPRWSARTRDVVVGNGGFALRKVASAWAILTEHREAVEEWGGNEDMFWAFLAGDCRPFAIPSLDEAVGFAFESRPERAFALNRFRLPFGCHAWRRGGTFEFWQPILTVYGYQG